MKWLGIVAGVTILLLAALYALLFTAPGNALIAPLVVSKINRTTALQASLEKFELRPGRFAVALVLSPGNRLETEGDFALFSRSLKATYRLRCNDLATLQALTKTPVYGRLQTEGTVTGNLDDLVINGTSDLAGSATVYTVTLTDLNPGTIKATVTDAQATQLLLLLGKKPFSSAKLSLDIDLKNLDPQALDGEAVLTVTDGAVDAELMEKEFGLTLPNTSYSLKGTSHLEGSTVSYSVSLESNPAHFFSAGRVSPESLQMDLQYQLDARELALFKPLTNAPLRGPFKTSGTVKGDRAKMTIAGTSDLAAGQANYDLKLEEFKPREVLVKVNNAQLDKLLYMAMQPPFAKGRLDVDLNLTDLDPENLQGKGTLKIGQGELVGAIFKKEYGIDLPQTPFGCNLEATLKGKAIDYLARFDSKPAKLDSGGTIIPKNMGMDLKYRVDIAKLELLQPFTGTPLRGTMKLNGTAKGDRKLLTVEGSSDLAGSDTSFRAGLADFKPASIKAKIKNLQLARALAMLAKPHYADGVLNVEIDIANAKTGELQGNINSGISQGLLDSKVIATEFELGEMPKTSFGLKARTTLAGNFADTAVSLDSSLLTLKVNRARYDLAQSLLASDYQADIPDLDKLFFVAGRHLKGAMRVKGELKKGAHLDLTAHSDALGGRLEATVHDDQVKAKIDKIQTLEALKMLIYPEIFASSLDGSLDYDLERKTGTFDAKLGEGKFTRNLMLDLLLSLAQTDLYKERFTGTLHSDISRELISSDLELRSNTSSISGKRATLNSKTRQVSARLDVVANNNPIGVTIKGSVDKPEVKLDTSALIKKEAGKALQKEVDKLLKKLF